MQLQSLSEVAAYQCVFGVGVRLAADSQSTSSSWYRAPLWGTRTRFYLFFSFDSCFIVLPRALSLTRGRVCNLQCNRLSGQVIVDQ
jgi:hypothetical protein